MAKKKLIVKATDDELEKEEAKRIASKRVVKEREKGKKLKKEDVAKEAKEVKEEVVKEPKKKVAKKKAKEAETSEETVEPAKETKEGEKLSIDEVVEEVEAFKEEAPSELEKDMIAAENKFEEEIQEERIYTVPLAKLWGNTFRGKKTKKAMKCLHEFVTQHMKPEVIYIDPEVNSRLWENGIRNPPRRLRVRVTKSTEGLVRVYLA